MELNNGGRVLHATLDLNDVPESGHVLAFWHDNYVVWHVYRWQGRGDVWECEGGNYFHTTTDDNGVGSQACKEAKEAYKARAGLLWLA